MNYVKISPFNWEDHEKYYDLWFEQRKAEKPPRDLVSPTGIVVSFMDTPVCMGFMCKTDSKMALMTNFISDPNSPKEIRSICLDLLIDHLMDLARSEDFKFITAATVLPVIVERFEKHDFKSTHENLFNLGREL